ncbi:flagellar motor switch protein FliN [Alteromonas macleodii]|jgi:flagellar motor switch protein FliN/FliY|uniref:Flagellar motor switch protein FliN n=6 Tax=root TaxID=1 RepID=A0A126PX53_ALTMA|nr:MULTISPECIES: flagellar motor switch protein FliN [Alteromonas]AFT77587.1 flagellar motor switch protein [Alteromonas macleodii str. 'Black Sea 11']APD85484.1 flagellar motor switch protein FliN [Alteromonas sp. Mex14]MCG8496526.1 flagellar motor switch protein FliN [Enterobacterales bacterium]MDY6977449.1 flagellar motor switch protein FliN [Pseudomonadota bacterium]NKW88075.1 flagellar motor switch protein FliN [Alteromonadaceae bacterium A_SAG4]NKX03847.1 flagellar motor switch protein |tara:strand:- start:995 stop:1402 length:408 start_codon:yes stop_codon:yes gene_type:complete|eukprot:TRINITY_DN32921_c0_g1_i1.p2 TRINITY_DN32921_c0_g1~~TRINITY_DN32921_c0_g1_i1.p2  ORF type:complete len:136 (+),score=26.98 TRINITY_DN32921_c0_g1_i1:655-1062(+)
MSEDGMDDWAAAMAEQAESEAEQEAGDNEDVQVAELDELTDDAPITQEEKKKLDTILDIPVTISMEVGRSQISIRNLLQLNQGSVVELDRVAGEPLDVLVNGTLIAHGEVVVVNDKFGIRLTDVISQIERIKKLR